MRSAKSVGRIIGMLLLVQLAGLTVPFVLLLPLTKGPSEFLANAAGISFQIKVAVFLLFANCALTIGITIAAFPVFRQYSHSMAHLLVAVSVIMFSLQAVDNAHLLSMLSLSHQSPRNGTRNPARWAKHSTYLRFRLAYVLRLEMVPFLERAFRVPCWVAPGSDELLRVDDSCRFNLD